MQEQSNFTAQELRAKAPLLLGFVGSPHCLCNSNNHLSHHVKHICMLLSRCALYSHPHTIQRAGVSSIVSILQLGKQTEINGFAIVTLL